MTDILKESPAYRWMTDDAREEGLEQGLERGLEQGLERGRKENGEEWLAQLRSTIIEIVSGRFPRLVRMANKLVSESTDVERLQHAIVKISLAHIDDDIEPYLWELDEKQGAQ